MTGPRNHPRFHSRIGADDHHLPAVGAHHDADVVSSPGINYSCAHYCLCFHIHFRSFGSGHVSCRFPLGPKLKLIITGGIAGSPACIIFGGDGVFATLPTRVPHQIDQRTDRHSVSVYHHQAVVVVVAEGKFFLPSHFEVQHTLGGCTHLSHSQGPCPYRVHRIQIRLRSDDPRDVSDVVPPIKRVADAACLLLFALDDGVLRTASPPC